MHGGNIYSNQIEWDFSVNINPLGVSEGIKNALLEGITKGKLENYPDLECTELRKALSEKPGVPAESLLFGNGASELILAFIRAIAPQKILLLAPCFSGYGYAAQSAGSETAVFSLSEEQGFRFDQKKAEEYINFAAVQKVQLGILANPNNPNGTLIEPQILLQIAEAFQKSNKWLLIDECFIELTEKSTDFSLISYISKLSNVIILRSFTKTFAIPGIRLGYSVCSDSNLNEKAKNQLPEWNISVLAQIAGTAALKETEYLSAANKLIKKERAFLSSELENLGFKVFPSETCFLLFKINEKFSNLYEKLLQKKILIRSCMDYNGLGKDFYRIAVKNHGQNQILVDALKEINATNLSGG